MEFIDKLFKSHSKITRGIPLIFADLYNEDLVQSLVGEGFLKEKHLLEDIFIKDERKIVCSDEYFNTDEVASFCFYTALDGTTYKMTPSEYNDEINKYRNLFEEQTFNFFKTLAKKIGNKGVYSEKTSTNYLIHEAIRSETKNLAKAVGKIIMERKIEISKFDHSLGKIVVTLMQKANAEDGIEIEIPPAEADQAYQIAGGHLRVILAEASLVKEIKEEDKRLIEAKGHLGILLKLHDSLFPVDMTVKRLTRDIDENTMTVKVTKKLIEIIEQSNKVKYVVDQEFLAAFIKYFVHVKSSSASDEEKIRFINLVFNIDLDKKSELELVNYAFDFDLTEGHHKDFLLDMLVLYKRKFYVGDINRNLSKKMKQKLIRYAPEKKTIKNLDKLRSTKHIFTKALNQLMLLSQFKWFYLPKNIRYIGRLFAYNSAIIDLQNYKLIKAFIAPRCDHISLFSEEQFEQLKIAVNSVMDYKENNLIIDYETYKKQHYVNISNWIHDPWKNVFYVNLGHNNWTRPNFGELLDRYFDLIKKPQELIMAIHNCYRVFNPAHKQGLFYSKDASSSGLQLIAILFRAKKLATLVNLVGDDKQNIYALAGIHVKERIVELQNKPFIELKNERDLISILQSNPEYIDILTDKIIYKKAIMTYGYGMNRLLRFDTFKEELDKYIPNNTELLASFLTAEFETLVKKFLPEVKLMRNIGKIVFRITKGHIQISTPYLKWRLNNYMFKLKDIWISNGVRTPKQIHRRMKVYDTVEGKKVVDKKKWIRGFNPIFVHSADAMIAHNYLSRCVKLQTKLKSLGLSELAYYTNHDCFFINEKYEAILDSLVKDSYMEFYEYDYLKILNKCIQDKESEEISKMRVDRRSKDYLRLEDLTNPWFIKY